MQITLRPTFDFRKLCPTNFRDCTFSFDQLSTLGDIARPTFEIRFFSSTNFQEVVGLSFKLRLSTRVESRLTLLGEESSRCCNCRLSTLQSKSGGGEQTSPPRGGFLRRGNCGPPPLTSIKARLGVEPGITQTLELTLTTRLTWEFMQNVVKFGSIIRNSSRQSRFDI